MNTIINIRMWGQIGFHSILSFTTHGNGDKVAQLSRKTSDLATLLLNIYIYIYAFSRRFYPKRLTVYSGYTFFVSTCVPWESNPQPLRC